LEIVGVGYRAQVQGKKLVMTLGYSHPVELDPPAGVEVAVEANTKLSVTGADKQAVGDFASLIRSKRPPEPYKGKGVKYAGERIRRKAGKAGKK
jgi:large subunit ribosomal protein L6